MPLLASYSIHACIHDLTKQSVRVTLTNCDIATLAGENLLGLSFTTSFHMNGPSMQASVTLVNCNMKEKTY